MTRPISTAFLASIRLPWSSQHQFLHASASLFLSVIGAGFRVPQGALRPSSGRSARVIGAGTMGHAFTPLRIGLRLYALDRGQAVCPCPSLRFLAEPGGTYQHHPKARCWRLHLVMRVRPVRARLLAPFGPFASVRHRPGATHEGPMLHTSGGALGPCHPHADQTAACRLWSDFARTARRAVMNNHGGIASLIHSATARRPSLWCMSLKSPMAGGIDQRRPD